MKTISPGVKRIGKIEVFVGLISLGFYLIMMPKDADIICGFEGAIKELFFYASFLILLGILTLLLHPVARWIHIIFSPIIAFLFTGLIFLALIPILSIFPFLSYIAIALCVILVPVFTIGIIYFFNRPEIKEQFRL